MADNTSKYTLLVTLGAEVNKSVDSAISSITKKISVLAGLKAVKDLAVTVGSAIYEYGKESLELYGQLEKSVVSAANVFGGTAEQVEENEDAIESFSRTMAKELPYSAQEVADSLYYLGLVGLDLQSSMDVADEMMELAYVNGSDVATTVDLITDAMSNLHQEINNENVTEFMDMLATTMSSTNTNAEQALEAILAVGSTAQMVDVNDSELSAYLGVLANYGVKGSEAGTALNSMLTRMVGNSSAIGAYEDLGVNLYDEAGNFRGVTQILKETQAALSELTDEERNPIVKNLFGTHYMNEANILLGAMVETTDELGNKTTEYERILEGIGESEGRLNQMAENSLDTWDAQSTIAQNYWDDLKLSFGKALEPAAVAVLQWVNSTLFPKAESLMDVVTAFIDEQVPLIPGYLDTAYEYVENAINTAKEYFTSDDWTGLWQAGKEFGTTLLEAFQSIDWPQVGETVMQLGDLAASVATTIFNIANSETFELLTNTLGKLLTMAMWIIEKLSGGLNDFFEWVNKWDFSSYFGSQDDITSDFAERASDAQTQVDSLNEQIEYYEDLIDQETDPKVISRLNAKVEELNTQLVAATDNLRNLKQAASGDLGFALSEDTATQSKSNWNYKSSSNKSVATPFAEGGIVTSPTLSLIGEAGENEAVIPLSKIGDVVGSVSGGSVTFSPVINVSGSGSTTEGIKNAVRSSFEEFKTNWARLQKEQRRLAF